MMRNKFLCSFLSLILILSFPIVGIGAVDYVTKDISGDFNADIIVADGDRTRLTTYTEILYDNAAIPTDEFELGSVKYKIYGDLALEGNDALKISANGSKDISFENSLVKYAGFIAATISAEASVNVQAVYEDNSTKNNVFSISPIIVKGTNNITVGKALVTSQRGPLYLFNAGDDNAYLNSYTIENEVKKLNKLTFTNNSSNDVYILAISTLAFDEDELAGAASSAVNSYYSIYKDMDFTQLDADTIKDVEALRDGLIAGKAAGSEFVLDETVDEAIEKFTNMAEGYYLYTGWKKEKAVTDTDSYYEKTEADFASFSDSDKAAIETLIASYEKLLELDYDRLVELCDEFGVTENLAVDFDKYEKTKALLSAYETYLEIKAIEAENENIYNTYKDVLISELDASDIEEIEKYIDNCNRLEELGGEADSEKLGVMKELVIFYENYQKSEDAIFTDLSSVFNIESIAKKGDKTSSYWLGGSTYPHFWGKDYTLINGLNAQTGIITLSDQKCVVTPKNDGTYSGKWESTGKQFYLKLTGLAGDEKDTLDISKLSENERTIPLETRVTDTLYLAATSNAYGSPLSVSLDVVVNYTDGTASEPYIIRPACGYNQIWGYSSTEGVAYPYQNGYFYVTGKNALADNNGVLEYTQRPQEKENGVVGTYALPLDSTKQASSITFGTPSVTPMFLYAITQKPSANTVFLANAASQWAVVKDYDLQNLSADELKEISLMLSYKAEADERGIPASNYADAEKISQMGEVVLVISGKAQRKDIDTIIAELEFSSAVSEAALKNALSVAKNNVKVSDYTLTLSTDRKKAEIEIPCDENGGDSIKLTASSVLAPEAYPNNKMLSDFELSYSVPEFLTVKYSDNKVTVTNNSATAADYNLYFTYYNNQTSEVIYAQKSEGSCAADSADEHSVSVSEAEGFSEYIFVTDDSFKHIAHYSDINVNTQKISEDKDYREILHLLSDNTIGISGFSSSENANKTVNFSLEDASGNTLVFLTQKTASDGSFSFKIKISDSMIVNEGYAKTVLSGDAFGAPYTDTTSVYLSKSSTKENAIAAIKNAATASAATTALKAAEDTLGLSGELFTALSDSLGDRLLAVSNEFVVTDFNGAKNIILRELALEAFSQGKASLLLKDGKLLYSEVLEYEKIDSGNVTLYSIFDTLLTTSGKEKAITGLTGKTLATAEQLRNELAISIANSVLNNCSQSGYSKYTCLLTTQNAQKLGIDISNYTNRVDKTALLSYLDTLTITNITEFETGVKAYTTPQDPDDGGSSSGGSFSGTSSGGFAMTPDVLEATQTATPSSQLFNDISEGHWAYSYFADLKAKNIINGDEKGNVNPDNNITRAEFVKILVASVAGTELGTMESEKIFNDVNADDWYFKYVIAAYKKGIIKGDEKGNFSPDAYITREDMCVMLYRMMGVASASDALSFSDSGNISGYAVDAVAYLVEKGIINGFADNTFKPEANATRAQCAKIISVYLSK